MRVLLAPDSFKGSLSAAEVSQAMKEGVLEARADTKVNVIPMADGGEGTLDVLKKWTTQERDVQVRGPAGQQILTQFAVLPYQGEEAAFIECARSTGLTLTPEPDRDPFLLNSYGLGEQIKEAVESGYRSLFISLGGSATTDGGTGLLQALGYQFYDENQTLLSNEKNRLTEIHEIDDTQVIPELNDCHITVLCDVTNPFYGENGAAYVYGPQKGATLEDVVQLDQGLRNLASLIEKRNGVDLQKISGAGAAGGLGGALAGALRAEMKAGFSVVAELTGLEERVKESDLVLTGEGSLDSQSAQGKVPFSVGEIASKYNVPAIGIAGRVETDVEYAPLTAVFSIQTEPCTLEEAFLHTYENIRFMAKQLTGLYLKRVQ